MSNKKLKAPKKPHGRPFLEVKRSQIHTLKLLPIESEKLLQMALKKGMTKSEYIRHIIFNS